MPACCLSELVHIHLYLLFLFISFFNFNHPRVQRNRKPRNSMPRLSLTSLFGVDPITDDEHHFETSWILPPAILACLRGLISLYIFVTIFIFWGWYGTHDDRASIGHSFSYFTWLSYWGIGFYMLFAAIHTACYARTGHSFLLDRWPRAFRVLHSLLYVTVTTYPFLVTIVYWALLFAPPWKIFTGWQNVRIIFLFLSFRYPAKETGLSQ
jgi:hypothetical protein